MEWKSLSGFQSLLDTLKIKTEQYIIVLFPFLGLLEEVKWISLGDAFQFLQCFILLKNQVLISDNGYDHFSSLLNSFFSQFITQGTILGIIQKWKNGKKKCLFKCGIVIMWAGCVFYSWYVAIRLYSNHAPQLCIICIPLFLESFMLYFLELANDIWSSTKEIL